jgi:hypothetical protein
MRWRVALLGLTALFAGCQGNPKAFRYVAAMNAERRALQDRVYELEYDLETLDMELGDAVAENERLKQELGHGGASSAPARRPSASPATPPPSRRDAPVDHDLSPPQIDVGDPDDTGSDAAGSEEVSTPGGAGAMSLESRGETESSSGAEPGTLLLPPPASDGAKESTRATLNGPRVVPTAATIASNDRRVVRVALDPARSGGADFDGKRGDDGVTVLVQPKNGAGQVVLDPGAISVAVLDPNRSAEEARVARWDLDAKQVAKLAENPEGNKGFKLHFAWPDQPPGSTLLRLYVRYASADGEHFDSEQEIHIELPEGARSGRPGWRAER